RRIVAAQVKPYEEDLPRVLVITRSADIAKRFSERCRGKVNATIISTDDQSYEWFAKSLRALTSWGRGRQLRRSLPKLFELDEGGFEAVVADAALTANGNYLQAEDLVTVAKELQPELWVVVHVTTDKWVSARLRKSADNIFWAPRDGGMIK